MGEMFEGAVAICCGVPQAKPTSAAVHFRADVRLAFLDEQRHLPRSTRISSAQPGEKRPRSNSNLSCFVCSFAMRTVYAPQSHCECVTKLGEVSLHYSSSEPSIALLTHTKRHGEHGLFPADIDHLPATYCREAAMMLLLNLFDG